MMRVLYIGNFDPFETGGTRRAYEVIRRIHKYGVKPYALYTKRVPNDVLTRIGALRSLKEIVTIIKSLDEVKKLDIDLVVATSEAPSCVITAYTIARKLNKPWTAIMQSPIKLQYTPASTEPIFIDPLWTPQQIGTLHLLKQTTVLTVSEACIVESTIKLPRYLVIRPGAGIEFEKYQSTDVSVKQYDAIFMARLTQEKGVYEAVKAWKIVVKEIPGAKLAIAGKPKNLRVMYKLHNLIQRYGLEKNVNYVGFVSGKMKVSLLKSSRIFIYPSRLDAFPIVILEALACGLPVIAFDIPAIRYNYPGNIVFRVPVGDVKAFAKRIVELLTNEDALRKIRTTAKFFAAKFNWDEVAKAEAKSYENTISYER
jgi:glycosyltransferase involved in cell wall biosynthesis